MVEYSDCIKKPDFVEIFGIISLPSPYIIHLLHFLFLNI